MAFRSEKRYKVLEVEEGEPEPLFHNTWMTDLEIMRQYPFTQLLHPFGPGFKLELTEGVTHLSIREV